jgi:predicted lipoprotein with Yx(FWY)xxD motif
LRQDHQNPGGSMLTIVKSRSLVISAVLGSAALAIAGCGSSAATHSATSQAAPATPAASGSDGSATGTVDLAKSKLGQILVNGTGRTLYLWKGDRGTTSNCSGACASAWPPITTKGKPVAGAGVSAAKLGVTKRADGSSQVTYDGHPLYTFAEDTRPGQVSGQGSTAFGAAWYVLSPAGRQIVAAPSHSASSSSGSGY